MIKLSINRDFKTFAEAATWADDEIAKYLAQGYSAKSLSISDELVWDDGDDDFEGVFGVDIRLEKHEA